MLQQSFPLELADGTAWQQPMSHVPPSANGDSLPPCATSIAIGQVVALRKEPRQHIVPFLHARYRLLAGREVENLTACRRDVLGFAWATEYHQTLALSTESRNFACHLVHSRRRSVSRKLSILAVTCRLPFSPTLQSSHALLTP